MFYLHLPLSSVPSVTARQGRQVLIYWPPEASAIINILFCLSLLDRSKVLFSYDVSSQGYYFLFFLPWFRMIFPHAAIFFSSLALNTSLRNCRCPHLEPETSHGEILSSNGRQMRFTDHSYDCSSKRSCKIHTPLPRSQAVIRHMRGEGYFSATSPCKGPLYGETILSRFSCF